MTEGGTVNNGANILTCGESTAPPVGLCASACSLTAGFRTELGFDSGEAVLERVVAVNGLSILVTASNFSAPKASNLSVLNCSVAEDLMKRVTVDDSADIPARCASTTLAGGFRASISGLNSEMATGPR